MDFLGGGDLGSLSHLCTTLFHTAQAKPRVKCEGRVREDLQSPECWNPSLLSSSCKAPGLHPSPRGSRDPKRPLGWAEGEDAGVGGERSKG